MLTSGSLMKSWVVAVVVGAMVWTGTDAAEKLATCCTSVSTQEITDPIIGYLVQRRSDPCVNAVIFQTEKGLFCTFHKARWVPKKIRQFEMARKSTKTASLSPSPPPSIFLSSSPPPSISLSSSPPSSSPPFLLSFISSIPPSSSSSPMDSTENASTKQSTIN